MNKLIIASLLILGMSNAFATGVNWREVKHCDQGYSLMAGHSWAPATSADFFQANISGEALESLQDQLGERINPMIEVFTDRFGHFTGKLSGLKLDIEENGNHVSLTLQDRTGDVVADYQFNNCR